MSLDWHMQGPEGRPDATVPAVPMDEDAHAELFTRAGLHLSHHGQGRNVGGRNRHRVERSAGTGSLRPLPALPLLSRATDYYENAAYAPAEVPGLLTELMAIAPRVGTAAEVVSALISLCEQASRRRRGIVVLAD